MGEVTELDRGAPDHSTTDAIADQAMIRLLAEPEARADPYPLYDEARVAGPLFPTSLVFWMITAHDECAIALRHPDLVRQHENSWEVFATLNNASGRSWMELQSRFMLWLDPPDHTRIRSLANKAFTPRYVERARPTIVEAATDLVNDLKEAGEADLISSLALPLPMRVICDMLGVPSEDRDSFRRWTAALAATLEPLPSEEVQDAADEAGAAFEDYFTALVAKRRKNLGDDLLSRMIEAEEEGERLSKEQLIANAILLLAAGFETTTNLIGNGTLALLRNRDQWDRLTEDPSLASHAVEELLRYDSPVQLATPRVARTDVEIAGRIVPEGEMVSPVVGAANRDPAHYEDPNRLDLTREDPAPLSFGGGPHFCLGAFLARVEGAIAFELLAKELPTLDLADGAELKWRPTLNIRGLQALHVTV